MSQRIQILTEEVINQIAAGEVIERPASILKELLENSIDAKSSMIKIYVENGGISLIKIIDDGVGIHPEDLTLAIMQHATSKIKATEDLLSINYLGFRGEALASIAAISKFKIISRQTIPSGTTVEVQDIFYNLPARKKFLRSNTTEYNFLQDTFRRIALSNFKVGFTFYHNNKLVKSLPLIKNNDFAECLDQKLHRISKLIGDKFTNNAIYIDSTINDLRLCGWISLNSDLATNHIQYCYINNRMVKDRLLNMAIRQTIKDLAIIPAYCLYFFINPIYLDVNVHPTKQEVRFSEPKVVYSFIQSSIEAAIKKIKLKQHDNFEFKDASKNPAYPVNLNSKLLSHKWQHGPSISSLYDLSKEKIKESSKLEPNNINEIYSKYLNLSPEDKQNINTDEDNFITTKKDSIYVDPKIITLFNHKFLVFEKIDYPTPGVIFLDVINSIKWLIQVKLSDVKTKYYPLIIPERVKSNKLNQKNLNSKLKLLEFLKFEVDQIHDTILLIRSVPECLNLFDVKINYVNFLEEFLTMKIDDLTSTDLNFNLIKLLVMNLDISGLEFYVKKDFLKLIKELTLEKYGFFRLNQQQFAMIFELNRL